MEHIAVLTSGGDAPGMNAAIRAVVRTACKNGMRVYGIRRGFAGLLHDDMIELDMRDVSNIMERGGTVLYSARCKEFKEAEYVKKGADICRARGISGMVVIGGDGSFRGAQDLTNLGGISCVAIPGTIDNDIGCTDYTIGFDTALNTIVEMVDRVRDTTEAHDRCSVIEVMGNRAGYLTLYGGIAVGATVIMIPEKTYDFEKDVVQRIRAMQEAGKTHFIMMVAEGIGGVEEIALRVERETGVESRPVILGHVQRGGSPTARDRCVASQMGNYAVELLMAGKQNRVVAMQRDKLCDFGINEALQMKKHIDEKLYQIAYEISI